jgi:hypothetical protein
MMSVGHGCQIRPPDSESESGVRRRLSRNWVTDLALGATANSGRRAAARLGRSARPGRRRPGAGTRLPSRGHESRDGQWRH